MGESTAPFGENVKVFTWWSNNTNEIQRIAISFLNCQLLDLGKTLSFVINQ
jgi:hypothetical protein